MYDLGAIANEAGDVKLAESWWQKAAALDDSMSMYQLGVLAPTAGDLELAKSWYTKAADLGDPDAMDVLKTLQQSS
jgi:TPR repeat protein